ncbi:hypothetical protein LX77_03737 [Gelidibacter algens]|uniref:Uncharacterized protein n=1 Tax=Gelidibacter algens TaxID=49280 RepID=A0A1A7QUC9_9FLAO|nr:hypothetical protein [Gelidibacter algens]OBX23630.1 hypothetical protein A9996_15815 [Gelidibacter algens]RAJ18702.1 hypothetical protein LX77_03737 [Gelidibacter algens]
MIVNPQFFNYRLIIGSLIVTIAILGVFSFTTYEAEKAHQQFLEQEKNLIEGELSQMISRYDQLIDNRKHISQQLSDAKKNTKTSLEKLRLLKSDFSVFWRFKSELTPNKEKNSSLLKTIDSIATQNDRLERDKFMAYNELDEQKKVNSSLSQRIASLNKRIEEGALLTANSFNAKAFKSGLNAAQTTKAAQANRIDVCFTLAENALTQKGIKEIYIQILNPLNNVIADKGAVKFGESLLIYSDKQLINYNNDVIDVCTIIKAQKNDKPFAKGIYYISVFHENRKLGTTQVVLN